MTSTQAFTTTDDLVLETFPLVDKIIELVAVLILGLCTIGTAWCAFQATNWNGASSDHAQQSSDQRVESSRLFGLATQRIAYDSTMIAQYAAAVSTGDTKLRDFYRTSLIRPAFLPTLDVWQAEVEAGRTPTPLSEDQDYLSAQLADYQKSAGLAEGEGRLSQQAAAVAGSYVSVTILLAVALFFSGVVTTFRYRAARALLLAGSLATLAVAASRLGSLPVLF